jgi:hypothetical protein
MRTLLFVAAPVAFFSPTRYTIKPGDNIHERMTMASKRCLDIAVASNTKPASCNMEISKDLPTPVMTWLSTPKVPDLEEAVRWPDDPTHQISLTTALKMLASTNKCKSHAEKGGRRAAEDFKGLNCASNFGTMQFFHAQATARGEPASETYYKISHWAQFLFDVATTYTDAQLDQRYCDVFSSDNNPFQKAMVPEAASKRCGNGKPGSGWHVVTLFTTKCRNILTSSICSHEKKADRYDIARMYAIGSILHMIQDSYSQSHCVRSQCEVDGGKVVAKVECTPIRMFTTYPNQQNHADADRDPQFEPSCGEQSRPVDDPITAGAKVLWDVQHKVSRAEFNADIERVFGTAAQAASLPNADLGECFSGKLN